MTEPSAIAAETPSVEGLMELVRELENEVYDLGAGKFFTTPAYEARDAVLAYATRLSRAACDPQPVGWISVDTPPKEGRKVILVAVSWLKYHEHEDGTPANVEGVDVTEGQYVPQHGERPGYFESFMGDHGDQSGITHWMLLPPPPPLAAQEPKP